MECDFFSPLFKRENVVLCVYVLPVFWLQSVVAWRVYTPLSISSDDILLCFGAGRVKTPAVNWTAAAAEMNKNVRGQLPATCWSLQHFTTTIESNPRSYNSRRSRNKKEKEA